MKEKLNINSVSSHLPLALSICLYLSLTFYCIIFHALVLCNIFSCYIMILNKKKNKNDKKIKYVSEVTKCPTKLRTREFVELDCKSARLDK